MTSLLVRALGSRYLAAWVTSLGLVVWAACASGSGSKSCTPGESSACACTDGASGAQVCGSNGTYNACTCAGGSGSGGGGGSGGSSGGSGSGGGSTSSGSSSGSAPTAPAASATWTTTAPSGQTGSTSGNVCPLGWTSLEALGTASAVVVEAECSSSGGGFTAEFAPVPAPGGTAPCTGLTVNQGDGACPHADGGAPSGSLTVEGTTGNLTVTGTCTCAGWGQNPGWSVAYSCGFSDIGVTLTQ